MGEKPKTRRLKRTPETVSHSRTVARSSTLRIFKVGNSKELTEWREELDKMSAVLLGREEPPVNIGPGTLIEVASAYYSRAQEITIGLQRKETDGEIIRGSDEYKFRTGELRSFTELAKSAMDLGSRRVTIAMSESEQRYG